MSWGKSRIFPKRFPIIIVRGALRGDSVLDHDAFRSDRAQIIILLHINWVSHSTEIIVKDLILWNSLALRK